MFEYQVEWEDDDGKTHVEPYQAAKLAALASARRASRKHGVAYCVACKYRSSDRAYMACGHKSFGDGLVMETEGEGF